MKLSIPSINSLRPWCKVLALAYCHLPLIILAGIAFDYPSWQWLFIVALLPWMGMALLCSIPVCLVVIAIQLGFGVGTPGWLYMPVISIIIFLGGTLLVFVPLYWFTLKRAIDPVRSTRDYRLLLIIWALVGNLLILFLPPRSTII
jgi:hypothetical protein